MALRVREPAMDERVELQRLMRAETTLARLAQEARAQASLSVMSSRP